MKNCRKCSISKNIDDFYKHPKMPDGHLNICKECKKIYSNKRLDILKQDPIWVEKEKERQRLKQIRLNYAIKYKQDKETKSLCYLKWCQKYPEKAKAHSMCQNLKRTSGFNLHHWSYNEEHYKDVIKLTIEDHYKIHRYIIYDQERKMYRNLKGILLDTKQSHIDLLNELI